MDEVEIRRSARRRRTVQARREGDRIVVLVPAGLDAAEERRIVESLVAKIQRSEKRRDLSDDDLMGRCEALSRTYLDGEARPTSVRWVTNQSTRWGSCTASTGEIRISHLVREMPAWVVDYVLLHELVHLVVPGGHPPRFWEVLGRYPRAERARGFLEGAAHQR
ncbi:M48 family metallopeptidase [Aeromicrobium sp. Leaf350]|uniref:M48 metallopeptidase family protein n=1 Tax=Aeromicrobium sp. Leaf350 TaxID=2876565 RepID=UPI001E413DE4|nr:M48 family metallopeptidase [Aeromicrobium sp. Leaf350]